MSMIKMSYRDGNLSDFVMFDPVKVETHYVKSDEDFISLTIRDGKMDVRVHLPIELAKDFYLSLHEIFDKTGVRQ